MMSDKPRRWIITGIGRSGTSFIALLAKRLGHDVPGVWRDDINAGLEPIELARINDRLRKGIGVANLEAEYLNILDKYVVLKDPQLLRLHKGVPIIKIWHEIVSKKFDCVYIISVRNLEDVGKSHQLVPEIRADWNKKRKHDFLLSLSYVTSNLNHWIINFPKCVLTPSEIIKAFSGSRLCEDKFKIAKVWNETADPDKVHFGLTSKEMTGRGFYKYFWVQKDREILEFIDFCRHKGAHNFIEIGTFMGGTAAAFSELGKVFTINIEKGKTIFHRLPEEQRSRIIPIVGDSKDPETKRRLEEKMEEYGISLVDVLFIDGDHTYEGVKNDFETYRDLVKDGGIIAFHDILPHWNIEKEGKIIYHDSDVYMGGRLSGSNLALVPHSDVGAFDFWATEICHRYPVYQFIDLSQPSDYYWGGIGAIIKGTEISF